MTTNPENCDDDSFIIVLGTSPGASMDIAKTNGIDNGALDKSQIEDAMKDMSIEANMAFKAQFQLGESPSATSMMVASTIITDDKSTEELQKRFGELLDENVVLKETLKQNNDSMKEQFLLIASCQEDMLNTHRLHKEKFDETKELVERLRQENRKLKLEVTRIAESEPPANGHADIRSGASSGVEFVTSPDDDTIDKLTAQLELVEKQRRQVIVENEKLTWQKESLEHIVDVTTKERDELKEKLNKLELQLSAKQSLHADEMNKMNVLVQDLQQMLSSSSETPAEEIEKRNATIALLEGKVSMLQNELQNAQIKILDLENVKLEFSQHKSAVAETVRMYKEHIQDLNNRLKEAQTVVFQPVRLSVSSEPSTPTAEYAQFASNIKLYDRTLKHLAEFLNTLTHGLSDSLVQTLGVVSSVQDMKMDRAAAERVSSGLADVKTQLETQHSMALSNIGQVRGILSIFEGIFKDFNELLKKVVTKQECKPATASNVEALTAALVARGHEIQALQAEISTLKTRNEDIDLLQAQVDLYKCDFQAERESRQMMANEKENVATDLRTAQRRITELVAQKPATASNVEALTAALVARGHEIQALQAEISTLKTRNEDIDLLQAQVDLYKCDFQAERESRQMMANEKENVATDLRTAQRRITELVAQLEEVRKLNPDIHRTVTAKRSPKNPSALPPSPGGFATVAGAARPASTTTTVTTGNMVYTCPKCLRFSSDQIKAMDNHFDFCLDDF